MKSSTNSRVYNLDLLRIVAMLMIVILHFLGKGLILDAYPAGSTGYNIAWMLESACLVAVNCYVLLSSYFLIHSQFRIKKLLTLSLQVAFYTIGIYLLLIILGSASYSLHDTINALLPTLTGVYWFVSIYAAMYILSPFLNKFLLGLSKKMHLALIVALVAIFSLWPTIFVKTDSFTFESLSIANGYSAIWFIVLYCIAAYIRQHHKPTYNTKKYLLRYFLTAAITAILFIIISHIAKTTGYVYFNNLFGELLAYNVFPTLIASVALFMVFVNLKITSKKINRTIAVVAPLTFAVYLIHEEPHVRALLWSHLNPSQYAYKPHFIIFAIISIFSIYVACILIDWIRQKLFLIIGKTHFARRLGDYIDRQFNRISQKSILTVQRFLDS